MTRDTRNDAAVPDTAALTAVEAEIKAALQQAMFVEVNGGELESIGTVYKPEGCAVVLWNAIKPFVESERAARVAAEGDRGRLTEAIRAIADMPGPYSDDTTDHIWRVVTGAARAALAEVTP